MTVESHLPFPLLLRTSHLGLGVELLLLLLLVGGPSADVEPSHLEASLRWRKAAHRGARGQVREVALNPSLLLLHLVQHPVPPSLGLLLCERLLLFYTSLLL